MSVASQQNPPIPISGRKTSSRPMEGGATFTLGHRVRRLIWQASWLVLAAWTPSFLWRWRGAVLRAFGAKVHKTAIVRGSARIWWPANLTMGAHSSLGPGALCYNVAHVTLAPFAIVSQRCISARLDTILIRWIFRSRQHPFASSHMAGLRRKLSSGRA